MSVNTSLYFKRWVVDSYMVHHGHLLCCSCSNYMPEVRIMSIPNLRYMKVSSFSQKRLGVRHGWEVRMWDLFGR